MTFNDQSFTIKDVAKFLNISTQMVHILIKKGQLKAFNIGSAIRILSSDLTDFIKGQKQEFEKTHVDYINENPDLFFIRNLSCHKGDFYLHGINLSFPKNKLLVLLGPSGSGKSLLLQSIAGLQKIDTGNVFLGTQRLDQMEIRDRKIGFVFENYALFDNLKTKDNIAFPLAIRHEKKETINERVKEITEELGIEAKYIPKHIDKLPEGIKQLVAIGKEKIRDLELLVLDEPMSKLDKHLKQSMTVFLKKLISRMGKTTIISLNDPELTLALADYVAVLGDNTIVQFGETKAVYEQPVTPFVMELLSRFQANFINVQIKEDKTIPLGLTLNKADGNYRLGFRAEEIQVGGSGIKALIVKSSFIDNKQKMAKCRLAEENMEVELILPMETAEEFFFLPTKPLLFAL
jgi:excisionase family DNA binding protein